MTITQKEADNLLSIAKDATAKLREHGAACAILIWTREVDGHWLMEWSRQGSPYEAVALAARYGAIDAQEAQAHAIASELNKDDDGESWKSA